VDCIFLTQEQTDLMKTHVLANLPEEACGMLGGIENQVKIVLPITNQAHSPIRYYMEPIEMLKAFEYLDQNGLELIATFHSHPDGPLHPSETDIREFMYPGTAVIIIAPCESQTWHLQAYRIEADSYREISIVTVGLP